MNPTRVEALLSALEHPQPLHTELLVVVITKYLLDKWNIWGALPGRGPTPFLTCVSACERQEDRTRLGKEELL